MKVNLNEIKDKMSKFVESKIFRNIIYLLGGIVILFFVFRAGVFVGFKKASFSHDWGINYENNFGPKRKAPPFMDDLKGFTNAHGAIGKIIKIDLPSIVVLDKDQTEKVVNISKDTNILERKEKVNKENLNINNFVVIIGSPNENGQIEAKLVRIIPSPEEMERPDTSRINPDFPFRN